MKKKHKNTREDDDGPGLFNDVELVNTGAVIPSEMTNEEVLDEFAKENILPFHGTQELSLEPLGRILAPLVKFKKRFLA